MAIAREQLSTVMLDYGECPEARLYFRHTTAAKPIPSNEKVVGSGVTVVKYRNLKVSDSPFSVNVSTPSTVFVK